MKPPIFPKQFIKKHCLLVAEARQWRKTFNLEPDPEDDEAFAQCAFHTAGCGLICQGPNCEKFLYGDSPFHEEICRYYRDMKCYEEWEAAEKKVALNNGGGI